MIYVRFPIISVDSPNYEASFNQLVTENFVLLCVFLACINDRLPPNMFKYACLHATLTIDKIFLVFMAFSHMKSPNHEAQL